MSIKESEDLLIEMKEIIVEKLNSYYHQLAVSQRRLRTVNHTTQKTSMERKLYLKKRYGHFIRCCF